MATVPTMTNVSMSAAGIPAVQTKPKRANDQQAETTNKTQSKPTTPTNNYAQDTPQASPQAKSACEGMIRVSYYCMQTDAEGEGQGKGPARRLDSKGKFNSRREAQCDNSSHQSSSPPSSPPTLPPPAAAAPSPLGSPPLQFPFPYHFFYVK